MITSVSERAREKIALAIDKATVYYPAFGAFLNHFEIQENPKAGTFKATASGVLQYDPECVDVTPDNLLLSMMVHVLLHRAFEEAKRAVFHDVAKFRYCMESKINQILVEGTLPLGPGWIREPQWDAMAPEECVGECDSISEEEAVEICPVRMPLLVDDGTLVEDQEYDEMPDGTLYTSALVRMEATAKDIGEEMNGLQLMIGDVQEAQMGWNDELRDYFSETIGRKGRTYKRPSRRSGTVGTILPGRNKGYASITIAVDMSSSVTGDPGLVECFAAEMTEILRICDAECRIILFDTAIIDDFVTDDPNELIARLRGGGGTCFAPVFNLLENDILNGKRKPTVLAFLTDLYANDIPTGEPPYDVLWVCGIDHSSAPWGRVIELPTQGPKGKRKPWTGYTQDQLDAAKYDPNAIDEDDDDDDDDV